MQDGTGAWVPIPSDSTDSGARAIPKPPPKLPPPPAPPPPVLVFSKTVEAWGGDARLELHSHPTDFIQNGRVYSHGFIYTTLDKVDDVWGRLTRNMPDFFGWDSSNPMRCNTQYYDSGWNELKQYIVGGYWQFRIDDYQNLNYIIQNCYDFTRGS